MALDRRLGETLGQVAALLDDAREPWWIIGSAAVALHGGDAGDMGDVDVLLGTGDAHRIVDRLGLNRLDCDGDSLFRSAIFACWKGPPMKVEFMAELQVATAAGWVSVAPQTREIIRYETAAVAVPSRQELRAILMKFGREKDLKRAESLA